MKLDKKIIITSIICFLISGTIGVVASKLSAKDIGFTSTNENWQVNNVEDAMNDLYDKSQNGIIVPYIKEYTDGGYQNREWSYYRSTPVVTISPNGSTSFTMSNFGYQRVDSTGYDPVYHTITSVENGTFDGLTVYPIDKNADVIITFNLLSTTYSTTTKSVGTCSIVSYE